MVVPIKPEDGLTVIEIDSLEAKHGVENKRAKKIENIHFIIFPFKLTRESCSAGAVCTRRFAGLFAGRASVGTSDLIGAF